MDAPLPFNLVECWSEFLKKDYDSLDPLFDHPVLFPLQRRREMKRMHQLANEIEATTVMEIGADKGGSIWAWLLRVPSITHMIVCEIRGTPYSEKMQAAFPDVEFLWLPKSSYNGGTPEQVRRWLGEYNYLDVLFIDGDKSNFLTDFECYRPMVGPGGIIMMHDVEDDPVSLAYARARSAYKTKKVFEIKDTSEWEELERSRTPIGQMTGHEEWLNYWKGTSCTVGVIYK